MLILGIISVLFVIIAIVLVVVRLVLDVRFTAIQKEPDQSILFRRKVNYLRKIEQARHIRYLLLTTLFIGLALLVFVSLILCLADDHQKIKAQNNDMQSRITRLEQQQEHLIASIPLKKYPETGIGLKDYDWDKLTTDVNDPALQTQIESELSQKTLQYFGSSDTVVSLAVPKTLSLHLKGEMLDSTNQELIKKNLDEFAKEAEVVPNLIEIKVQMITVIDKTKKVVYSVNYSREKNEDTFKKKNVSEQNLKNDGGKG